MKVNVCRDPSLVTSATLRIRALGYGLYVWRWGAHFGREDWPTKGPGVSRIETPDCQVCGQSTDGYEVKTDWERFLPQVPLWPGGPMVEDPISLGETKLVRRTWYLTPCNHAQPRPEDLRFIQRGVVRTDQEG